jgi:hypothetical protein
MQWLTGTNAEERGSWRQARRELDALFNERTLLKGTSLKPHHLGRTQVLEVLEEPRRILFGIVRHPRPYAFSRQVHEVLEVWCYHLDPPRLERVRGHNLSRKEGGDGQPSSHGTGV